MTDAQIYDGLRKLNLRGCAEEYQYQCQHPELYRDMSFDSRLTVMIDKETSRRETKKVQALIRKADFKYPKASAEDILYYEGRHLDKAKMLKYADCSFIDQHMNLIFQGPTGSGKTWISCAIGISACRKTRKVKYLRAPELLDELMLAKGTGDLHNYINEFRRYECIIIDDWLIAALNVDETLNMLEFLESCELHCSLIFCTQYPTTSWYERINSNEENKPVSEAVFERIVFNADDPIELPGETSVRELLWKERTGKLRRTSNA